MNAADGSLARAFYELVSGTTIVSYPHAVNIKMDSSNKIYFVTTYSQRINVVSFNAFATAPITPNYYKSYGSIAYPMIASSLFQAPDLSVNFIVG